jgi:hypothetical protein
MATPQVQIPTGELTSEEASLITVLRQAGPGLRECLWEVVAEMLRFAAEPGCNEAGVGGMPCLRLSVACDHCRRVSAALAAFKQPRGYSRPMQLA